MTTNPTRTTRITTPFGFSSTALEVIAGIDLTGKRAIVTGRTTDMTGVAPYTLDPANADRLWDVSLHMLG